MYTHTRPIMSLTHKHFTRQAVLDRLTLACALADINESQALMQLGVTITGTHSNLPDGYQWDPETGTVIYPNHHNAETALYYWTKAHMTTMRGIFHLNALIPAPEDTAHKPVTVTDAGTGRSHEVCNTHTYFGNQTEPNGWPCSPETREPLEIKWEGPVWQ